MIRPLRPSRPVLAAARGLVRALSQPAALRALGVVLMTTLSLFAVGVVLATVPAPGRGRHAVTPVQAATHVPAATPRPSPSPKPPFPRTEERDPCTSYDPLRTPFFGDLHVHTALSLDAATQGTRNRPLDAYRFARGEPLGIQPYTPDGKAMRQLALSRPLDFAAVTDHAEFLGEVNLCETAGSPAYESVGCMIFRRWPRLAFFLLNGQASPADPTRFHFCGDDAKACRDAAVAPWQEIRDAAEAAYDRSSACGFTTFVGYEWTGAPDSRNLHRNVLFHNDAVPALPISLFEATRASELWKKLDTACEEIPNCDVLAIPHNSNLSGGLMFADTEEDGRAFTAAYVEERAAAEPLVEMMQHKGDSECLPGTGANDEQCAFEKLPYDRFGGKFSSWMLQAPTESSFVRSALARGLVLERKLGTNPFKLGIVAGTDTHIATPGFVDERAHPGHGGAGDPASHALPAGLLDDIEFNPGGLSVLWAEENSRDALFAAMRRREAYGTSGPRMIVRFFGGFGYSPDLCSDPSFVERGYAKGVPMGGDLPAPDPADAAPTFALTALRDAGTPTQPGTPLERLQIVKGWMEGEATHEAVYDVAGAASESARVDPNDCTIPEAGSDSLCTVWTDPDFDPAQSAFYYVRVLEIPTCRWSTYACNAAGVRCDQPDTIKPGFAPCCDTRYPRTIQERAWTSPIWYTPKPATTAP